MSGPDRAGLDVARASRSCRGIRTARHGRDAHATHSAGPTRCHARGLHSAGRAILLVIALAMPVRAAEPVTISGRAMGTAWSVKFVQPGSRLEPEETRQRVADRLEQLERMFSTYRDNSDVSRFNASRSTDWFSVPAEVARVGTLARQISTLTGGAFDITVAPLVELWGFGPHRRTTAAPTEHEIVVARHRVDWRALDTRAEPPALRKAGPAVAVDFSSIAKGYAADALGELLAARGAARYFVQVGGDVKTGGAAPDGREWRAGIEEPRVQDTAVACVVGLSGQALSTSGDYRNFVTLGGKRYGHIIDPRTGRPAESKLAAVSVVHASAAWSSALATAIFVLGPDDGFALARREKFACVFFLREGDVLVRRTTPEFERLVR